MPWAQAPRVALGARGSARSVVLVVGLGLALLRFDFSLNIALPAISAALGEELSGVQWAIAVYLLVQVALLPLCGALSDRTGHRLVYLAGLAAFSASAAVAATAATLPHLLIGRALQGVGAAMLLAAGPALIVATLPPEQRGRALGYVGAAQGWGQIVGPTLGGVLVDIFGWPAIFSVRIPVGVGLLILAWLLLPAPTRGRAAAPLDAAGALSLGFGATALLYGLNRLSTQGLAPEVVVAFALGLAALVAFVGVERRAPAPLLPLRLLRSRPFAAANLSWVLAWVAIFGIWLLLPFFLVRALGLPAGSGGLLLAVVALGMAAAPVPFGAWADRRGPRAPGLASLTAALVGLVVLARLDAHSPWPAVALGLALVGCGIGGFQATSNALIVQLFGPREIGVASGVVSLGRNLGVVTGVVVASSVFSVREAAHRAAGAASGSAAADGSAFVLAHQDAFLAAASLMGGALAAYLWGTRGGSVGR